MNDLIRYPTDAEDEWNKDHKDFVLNYLLPMVRPRARVRQVMVWAYEDGMEHRSNGSSVIPDNAYDWGNIKDPQGVAHDWIFELHHKGLPDPQGHYWTLWEANNWYRLAWIDFHHECVANVYWVGLTLGSWCVWNFGK